MTCGKRWDYQGDNETSGGEGMFVILNVMFSQMYSSVRTYQIVCFKISVVYCVSVLPKSCKILLSYI